MIVYLLSQLEGFSNILLYEWDRIWKLFLLCQAVRRHGEVCIEWYWRINLNWTRFFCLWWIFWLRCFFILEHLSFWLKKLVFTFAPGLTFLNLVNFWSELNKSGGLDIWFDYLLSFNFNDLRWAHTRQLLFKVGLAFPLIVLRVFAGVRCFFKSGFPGLHILVK